MYQKILIFIYAFIITIFLSACGDSPINPDDTNASSSPAAATNTYSETSAEENMPIVATKEIIDADYYSGLVQIDEHLIQLPITLNELLDMGFDCLVATCSISGGFDPSSYNDKTCLISPGEYYNFALVYNGEIMTDQIKVNSSETIQTITEINPTIYFLQFRSNGDTSTKVWGPGGLMLGAHYSDIEKTHGTPRYLDSTNMFYHYGSTAQREQTIDMTLDSPNVGMVVGVDKTTQAINYVQIGKSTDFVSFDSFIETTVPLYSFLVGHPNESTFTALFAPTITSDNNLHYTLIEHEGQKYILWLKVQLHKNTTTLRDELETLYSVIEEDGTKRELRKRSLIDNQYVFRVEKGDFALTGSFYIKDLSESMEHLVTDDRFLDKIIEIVNSVNY